MSHLYRHPLHSKFLFFFFNDTATTEIYTLSLHDALPIWLRVGSRPLAPPDVTDHRPVQRRSHVRLNGRSAAGDRKSTRLNSSHLGISYAVFCLKKKKNVLVIDHHTGCIYMHISSRLPTHG